MLLFRDPPPAAARVPMAGLVMLVAAALALCLLLAPPGLAWYKQAAGPVHYSRGLRRGPVVRLPQVAVRAARAPSWARDPRDGLAPFPELRPSLRSLVSTGRRRVRGAGGVRTPPPPPPAPRPCASRTLPGTCRAASGSPTAEPCSSARPTSSCHSAPRTIAAREARSRNVDLAWLPRAHPGACPFPGTRWHPVPPTHPHSKWLNE